MNKLNKLSSKQISDMVSVRFSTKGSLEDLKKEVSEINISKKEIRTGDTLGSNTSQFTTSTSWSKSKMFE